MLSSSGAVKPMLRTVRNGHVTTETGLTSRQGSILAVHRWALCGDERKWCPVALMDCKANEITRIAQLTNEQA